MPWVSCVVLLCLSVVLRCLLSEHFIDNLSHVYIYLVWCLASYWFDYHGLLLYTKFELPCVSGL